MERVISFRIWNKKTNSWLHDTAHAVNLFGEVICFGGLINGIKLLDLNELVAMQYTGLLDRNGKEIFEGDIIEYSINQTPFDAPMNFKELVEWKTDQVSCGFKTLYFPKCQIIGNIYEHPELLK